MLHFYYTAKWISYTYMYIYIYPLFIGFPFHLGYQRVLSRLPWCSTTEYSRLSLSVFPWSSQPFACSLLTSSLHVLKSKPSAPQYLPSSTWRAHIPRADVPRGSPPCRKRKHSAICIHSHQFTVDPPFWAFCPSLSPRDPHIWMHHSQKPLESYHGPPQKLSTPPISLVPTSQKTIYPFSLLYMYDWGEDGLPRKCLW